MDAPPTTIPTGPQPSQIQTRPPFVAFKPDNVPPSQYLYLQEGDFVLFNILSNVVNYTLTFRYRYLTPLGEIKEGTQQLVNTGQVIFTAKFHPGECWILTLALQQTGGLVSNSWYFAQIHIVRGYLNTTDLFSHGAIWEGYVLGVSAHGWPGTTPQRSTDGAGTLRSITGNTPAGGADISETVPQNRRWNLLSFFATLTTSAVVANRQPILQVNDGAHNLLSIDAAANVVASTAIQITWAPGFLTANGIRGDQIAPIPTPTSMKGTYKINTFTANLQAGDSWSAPQYLVQEWGMWDG